MTLPYFIEDLAGIGGTLKQRPEDFVVHEVPRYEPCGDGEHVMAEIEKTGLSTIDMVDLLSRRLKVHRRDIGYAGLKDTAAVTRQWVTLRGTTPEAVVDVSGDKLKVLYVDRHRNKLRLGHLAGNRFTIKIRDVDPMKVVTLTLALRTLARRGMPNYFGPQRFGRRDLNDELGLARLRGDQAGVLRLLLGGPRETDDADEHAARSAYEAGDTKTALERWPRRGKDERDALRRLNDGKPVEAVASAIDSRVVDLWMSAVQSRLFNATVAARIKQLDEILDGEIAYKHNGGAVFRVESAVAERERAERFEISPTGPLVGSKMMVPASVAGDVEKEVLAAAGVASGLDAMPLPGSRRPLRVRPEELHAESGIDEHGPYISLAFMLPAGSYATVLLREIMRNDA
ncbi:MAG: tRNA pseudouridine(13) synthase TruD [Tepidisphaeraceae bacterium]